MAVYNRLNEILKERGISQRELARMIGLSQEPVRKFANNQSTRYSTRMLDSVCQALHIDISDLLYRVPGEEENVENRTEKARLTAIE